MSDEPWKFFAYTAYLFYIVNITAADDLARQGARVSTTMVLTMLNRINSVPTH